ncbi:expressed unknown protein [Ectocarpus siliculosus]|uniref:Uncharacterized protein n=1 Tax=Ectocarpus siliculosus TaxID=2880 RepID=D7FKP8_ECTSI|nr:expressed unknown protein [Ectocarpus siliculosus]|eukprot:CBJ29447.1 expressed unknown protein [Ectocarpus siliculosus]
MSTTGTLSSYFTKRREVKSSRAGPEELHVDSSSSSGSVRARLEKKLQVKQKTGFAFNFAVDSDADEQRQGGGQEGGDAGERGSFCFNFNPADASAPTCVPESNGAKRRSGDASSLRAAQDFLTVVEKSGAQPSGKKKRTGAGKKKKKKKKKGGKGEAQQSREQKSQDPVGEGPEQDNVVDCPTFSGHCTVGDGGGEATSSAVASLPAAAASDSSPKREHRQRPPGLRPPPGFTLESWKDPAITGEERRRRRFGSGVRNMVAIQRSCDARRGLIPDGEVGEEKLPERQGGGLGRPGCDRARGMVGAGAPGSTTGGGSSVFAFGFDIGISFDGGS